MHTFTVRTAGGYDKEVHAERYVASRWSGILRFYIANQEVCQFRAREWLWVVLEP